MRWFTPGFQVTAIDLSQKTMALSRANHTYLVQCGDACDRFEVGGSYNMEPVEGGLRYRATSREIVLPILQEEVGFTTPGGRG